MTAMYCFHCHQPIVQTVDRTFGTFRSWRHLDGRLFCSRKGAHVATPDFTR